MSRPRPISRTQLNCAYRSLVHALYYVGPREREIWGILETARRELFREKFRFTKYPIYGHQCNKCYRYSGRHEI
jgi:hypothetical protein